MQKKPAPITIKIKRRARANSELFQNSKTNIMAKPATKTVTIAKYSVKEAAANNTVRSPIHHFLYTTKFIKHIKAMATKAMAIPTSAPMRVNPSISARTGDVMNGPIK